MLAFFPFHGLDLKAQLVPVCFTIAGIALTSVVVSLLAKLSIWRGAAASSMQFSELGGLLSRLLGLCSDRHRSGSLDRLLRLEYFVDHVEVVLCMLRERRLNDESVVMQLQKILVRGGRLERSWSRSGRALSTSTTKFRWYRRRSSSADRNVDLERDK